MEQFTKMEVLLAGAAMTLLVKIVYDWLKNRPNGETQNNTCKEHANCEVRIRGCENKCTELETGFRDFVRETNRRLEQGQESFERLYEIMGSMDRSITEISTIIKERAKTEGPLFQNQKG